MTIDSNTLAWLVTAQLLGYIAGLISMAYVVKLAMTGAGWAKRRELEDERPRMPRAVDR